MRRVSKDFTQSSRTFGVVVEIGEWDAASRSLPPQRAVTSLEWTNWGNSARPEISIRRSPAA